jgi:pSer/pThr/pTyr-binding forkhead associated (FHA) protein
VVGWLVALTGNHRGDDFRIREGKNSIGSAPGVDILITDGHISSKHANINYIVRGDERVFVLVDLDSTNGTFLNDSDEMVYHEELVDNDTITFGTTRCKFKCL